MHTHITLLKGSFSHFFSTEHKCTYKCNCVRKGDDVLLKEIFHGKKILEARQGRGVGWSFETNPYLVEGAEKCLPILKRTEILRKLNEIFPHDKVNRVLQNDTIVITKFQSRLWSHYSDIAIITLFHTSQIWRNLIWTFSMEKCFDGLFMEAVSDTCIAARTNQYS